MIQKKKKSEDSVLEFRFGLLVGSGRVQRSVPSHIYLRTLDIFSCLLALLLKPPSRLTTYVNLVNISTIDSLGFILNIS